MKKLPTLIAAIALIGTPAFAQAPPPPAPVYSWTGFYAGVNAGASMGEAKTNLNGSSVFASTNFNTSVFQITSGGFGFANDMTYPDGFIGGGQFGYNWQVSPLIVVGLEADIQGALEKDSSNSLSQNVDTEGTVLNPHLACGTPNFATHCTAVASYTTQIDWFGTVRGRLGYVWGNGEVMSYVTGGLAYGEVKINGASTVSGPVATAACGGCEFVFSQTQILAQSHINVGWVLGYGTEGRLATPGWTYKVEGLYMDLGHFDATSSASVSSCAPFGGNPASCTGSFTGGQLASNSHFTDWVLRGGLSYQFH